MEVKTKSLTPLILKVVLNKGTEPPYSGEYTDSEGGGTYLCRLCGLALFRSQSKFHSGCGWPSFDEELPGAVKQEVDADGRRREIICSRCEAHLGHVFQGEGLTPKNIRHCVNSLSLDFVPDFEVTDTEEALVAGGCFWGVDYFFQKLPGVLKTEVGYIGGQKLNPTYEEICQGNTGYIEGLRIVYDPKKVSYQKIIQHFFEIHDPSQTKGQGPDVGEQYLSRIYYYDEQQKKIAEEMMKILEDKGLKLATRLQPVSTFWPAESYHQNYYGKNHKQPYCHHYSKRF